MDSYDPGRGFVAAEVSGNLPEYAIRRADMFEEVVESGRNWFVRYMARTNDGREVAWGSSHVALHDDEWRGSSSVGGVGNWLLRPSGTSLVITDDLGIIGRAPVWSPDGGSIAFIGADGVYVVDAEGATEPRLVLAATDVRGLDW